MGRHITASCKLCRREGAKLFLKGEKCSGPKCPFAKRAYAPGQHGQGTKRLSEFGVRLREKQKARRIYGISERQFRKYYEEANKSKSSTGEMLLQLLERRLDNVIWRIGIGRSRAEARQMVRNGHVLVNGKRVNIPSFSVREGNILNVTEKTVEQAKKNIEAMKEKSVSQWLTLDAEKPEAKVISVPKRADMDSLIDDRLIVEFYSR